MEPYTYHTDAWPDFHTGQQKEWVMTNGLGSYGGASLIGSQNRTHQGYLIASLHSPIERYLVFSKVSEAIFSPLGRHSFHTCQYRKNGVTSYADGQQFLKEMKYDGTVFYRYETDSFTMEKEIGLKREENTCVISYRLYNRSEQPVTFTFTPYFNFREHSTNSVPADFHFSEESRPGLLKLTSDAHRDFPIYFAYSDADPMKRAQTFETDIELQTEVDLETEGLDSHYCPYQFSLTLSGGEHKVLSVFCGLEPLGAITAAAGAAALLQIHDYYANLEKKAGYTDAFANQLVLASDHFLSRRQSTGYKTVLAGLPWFTDWGRDTMIAFTGLTLCTGRFEEAKEILLTFAKYIKNGIVPNMFPDDQAQPLYNTADASLWYFYAVERFLHYDPRSESLLFIQEFIFPHLKEIISSYEAGTDFSIYMDRDGLIHAGSGLDQITWMDVRVGEWVVTPRHGKPVEINALWYNALNVMEALCEQFHEDASHYHMLAAQVKESFCQKFWNEKNQCLYDVIDGEETDGHIRPNQIYAVSLPYTMLPKHLEKKIVAVITEKLYVGCGLRSLACEDKDYHGIYCGALPKRDGAYHQGTAWGFLLGAFISAYVKVHHHSPESKKQALAMLAPVKEHLVKNGCIGSISEIFDGDTPHTPRGCYAQAWSVGEVLRAYCEDILL